MAHGELQRQLRNAHLFLFAMRNCFRAGILDFSRRQVPLRRPLIGQQPHRHRRGVDHPHAARVEIGKQPHKRDVVEAIMTIGENDIQGGLIEHFAKNPERQTADAYFAHFSLPLQFLQRGNRLVHHLADRDEFDVMANDQVNVRNLQPRETFVHAARNALRGEIKIGQAVTSDFGREIITRARNTLERLAEHGFRGRRAVVRGRVDEIDAQLERRVN